MSVFPENDPCLSLPRVIDVIARRGGIEIEFDDLVAAMGLAWLVCGVPGHHDVGDWMMYARDAFLLPACKQFGLSVREMHPPEAAKGLDRAAEFDQHFDASYRPLIHRALENGQAVVAWQGWPGEHRLHWGVIESACDDGVGFCGQVYDHLGQVGIPLTLVNPPTQLYVVETIAPVEVDRQILFQLVSGQIDQINQRDFQRRFGIVAGPDAFQLWNERMARADIEETTDHARFHASVISCHKIAQRWLEKNLNLKSKTGS